MRVFLAVEFQENMKEYLNQVQLFVKSKSIKGNFTKKENYHLTLQFIGEIHNNELEKLKDVIEEVALKQNCFQMTLNKLGNFVRGNKRIIWVGIEQNESLDKVYRQLAIALECKGYTVDDRKFVPHITLGREVVLSEEFNKIEEQVKLENREIPVSKIALMESTRLKGELMYLPLYAKEFGSS